MRQEVARAVHQLNGGFAIFHADVHVQSENQVGARHHLEVFHDYAVAVIRVDLLIPPQCEGMGAAGRKPQPVLPRQGDHLLADHADLGLGLLHVLADPGADLHHRLVHLRLDVLVQHQPALLHDLRVDVRTKIPRHRIHRLVFFFDSNVQSWSLVGYSAHTSLPHSSKKTLPHGRGSDWSRINPSRDRGTLWVRSVATTHPGTSSSDTPAAPTARAPGRSPCPPPPPRSTGNSPVPPIPTPHPAPDS